MPFDVYPSPQDAPLVVEAGKPSRLVELVERAAVDPASGQLVMFLRLAKVAPACAPAGPPHPVVQLRADDGPLVEIAAVPGGVPVPDAAGGDPVAVAELVTEPGDQYQVRLEVLRPGRRWRLLLGNVSTAEQRFTFVVADTAAGTRQPWIDVPATLPFTAAAGAVVTRELHIANHGTGDLVIADPDGRPLGSGFTLVSVAPRTVPPATCGVARISVTGTAGMTPPPVTVTLSTNDPTVPHTPGHNARVVLSLAPVPLWDVGDVLVLARTGDGVAALFRLDPATGRRTAVSVGQLLVDPRAAGVDPGGHAVVLDPGAFSGGGGLLRIDKLTAAQSTISAGTHLTGATDMAVEAAGTVLVVNPELRELVRIRSVDGSQTVLSSEELLTRPRGVAVEAGGTIVVANDGSGSAARVVRVDPASGDQNVVTSGDALSGPLGGPRAITVLSDGGILVFGTVAMGSATGSFSSGGTCKRIHPLTGAISPGMQGNFPGAPGNADAVPGGPVYVSGDFSLQRIDPATGARTTVTAPDGTTVGATGVAAVR